MQIECWSIQGNTFHFGQHGIGQEETAVTLPSDSLFAAMVARLARSQGAQAVEEFCRPFYEGDPPFVLSSTFLRVGNVRFFPVPLSAKRGANASNVDAKNLKKIEFVSEQFFKQLLSRTALDVLYSSGRFLQNGKLILSADEFNTLPSSIKSGEKIWEVTQRPRVTIDRNTSASAIFFTGGVTFAQECGLWFGVRWLKDDAELKAVLANLIADLADAGLGAERSTGMGAAVITKMTMPLELPDPNTAWVSISRYLPQADETNSLGEKGSAYALKAVGGWLDSPAKSGQRRRMVNLLVEGAVIGAMPIRTAPGQMVDVRPIYEKDTDPIGHPVYRNGFALAVGMTGGGA